VAAKIRDLVAAGATIIRPRPEDSPSLSEFPAADEKIRSIANDLWGSIDGKSVTGHPYGQGKVYWGKSVADVLAESKTPPDFQYNRPEIDSSLVWIHREVNDADIYFVANEQNRSEDILASFRIDGKEASCGIRQWHCRAWEYKPNGRTTVALHLTEWIRHNRVPSQGIIALAEAPR
jgi:hypothetical protein